VFIDNLFSNVKADPLTVYWESRRVGFIAVSDIAAMAAAVLQKGPEKHHGRDYRISIDALDGSEVAAIVSEVTGRSIAFNPKEPDDFKELVSAPGAVEP
jgi:NAD(P)H dehydrogenase (quinone)